MKKGIIIVAVLIFIAILYLIIPIKWTFGLRPPGNLEECLQAGGKEMTLTQFKIPACQYKNKTFTPTVNALNN